MRYTKIYVTGIPGEENKKLVSKEIGIFSKG
jgi:hypothetical protein